MPELPEVETVRRGLAPALLGSTISNVQLRRAGLRFAFPTNFSNRLIGATILSLTRRGKYLIAILSTDEALIMHLGMSGRFTITDGLRGNDPGALTKDTRPDPKHDHVVIDVRRAMGASARTRVTYNDPRRFGFMDLASATALEECRHFKAMGPEPMGNQFSPAGFRSALAGRRTSIKAALLDQRIVAGIGNIYACEALFRAAISPRRKAASVAGVRSDRLHVAIVAILRQAIEAGGSSLRDFAATDGELGYFQHNFAVYDREAAECVNCKTPIRRIVQAGRATFFCPGCQR